MSFQYESASNDFKGGAYLFSPEEEDGLKPTSGFSVIQVFKGKLLTILRCQDNQQIMSLVKYYP